MDNYKHKKSDRILEMNNNIEHANEIGVIINNKDELKKLYNILKDVINENQKQTLLDNFVFNKFLNVNFNFKILWIFIDVRNYHITFIDEDDINSSNLNNNNFIRNELFDGVWERLLNMNNNHDVKIIIKTLKNNKIIIAPDYQPKKYKRSINESLKDKLKGKSENEILNSVKNLTPEEKLEKGIEHNILFLVKQAIREGVDPSDKNNYALRHASKLGHLDVVKELLKDKRVDPSDYSNNPIRLSSLYGHLDVVKELLKDDRVDPSVQSNYAISFASRYGHLDVVKELLKDKRVDPSDNNNESFLFALENGHLDIVKELIKDDRVRNKLDIDDLIDKSKSNKDILNFLKKYKLKNMRLESFSSFILNNYLDSDSILEKSSLTLFGVPREVMQPIQKDFAIPADAEWNRIKLKREAKDILVNSNEKELILQIETDSIKVFVSYIYNNDKIYFVDTYVMKDTGWGGEFNKLERKYTSKTQILYQINSSTILYHLLSDFSIKKQRDRKVIKKESEFIDFTKNFKKDFLENFNNILKRIVGNKYKDVKEDIKNKAKQIEIEHDMILSGLDDPLKGPNGLTILDEFLYQFEEEYSDFFGERIELKELCDYFSREKIMTSFMHFIYTGKILTK